jgi:acyl-coenzyme A synthetase/AMP-(fatty) acid ligase
VLVDDDEVGKLEWPLERLWALRDERLRALIAHAKGHSRWHAERLQDVDPDGLDGSSLGRLPVMEKRAPMLIGTSSEPLFAPMARSIREGFGVEPSDTLAATEIGALAARTFPGAEGLRLAEDNAVYEVDEDGALLVTNVLNRALPLIRYRIGDRVRIDPSPGDIPWTGRVITILPPAETEQVAAELARLPAIVDYAITKDGDGLAVQVWAPHGSLDESQLRALETRLGCGASVTIVESVAELPRTQAGKRMRFIGF